MAPPKKALAQHESSQGASGKPSITLQQDRKKPRKIRIRTNSTSKSASKTSASKSQMKAATLQESIQEVSRKPSRIPLAQDKAKPKKLRINTNFTAQSIKLTASHVAQQPKAFAGSIPRSSTTMGT
jgi:cytochrome c-type biogenesis protein CcmH/NrfG